MTQLLTKAGAPRKRAPGAGQPSKGRTANLPRIRPEAYARLKELSAGSTVAETLEKIISQHQNNTCAL
ncbi:MAG: hypothetical protein V4621_08345, partial [Pseudomonadota bacterium]